VNVDSEVAKASPLAVRYETLVRVSQAIGAHGDLKELFGVLANELHRVVQFDFIGVSLREKNSHAFPGNVRFEFRWSQVCFWSKHWEEVGTRRIFLRSALPPLETIELPGR
jgi:hypothetical protein